MKILILLAATMISFSGNSQTNGNKAKLHPLLKVTKWGERAYMVPEDFWAQNAEQIIRQVGKEEYDNIRKNSGHNNIPCQMQSFCEDIDGAPKKNGDSLNLKLGKLIVYESTTFTHKLKSGRSVDFTILSIPYQANKNWDPGAKWDVVYFVIPSEFVLKDI